eukprot:SAG31_NODE_2377_length_5838_cov_35.160132_2_plen_52_part_00
MAVPQGAVHQSARTTPSVCDGATTTATMGSSVSDVSWVESAGAVPRAGPGL